MPWIRCSIYKHGGTDCSAQGISSRHDDVMLMWGMKPEEMPEEINGTPVVRLVPRPLGTKTLHGNENVGNVGIHHVAGMYYHAEPVKVPPPGRSAYMMGGCYIKTSDSRFPFSYPISLHDRAERL